MLGNVVESLDRQGRRRVYEYDELLRPRYEYWYNAAGTLENTIATTYDALSRVVGVSDDSSTYAYNYDAIDRLTNETISNPGTPTVTLATTYDRPDALRSSLSATIDGVADFRTTFGYDGLLRTTDIVQTGQGGNAVADKRVHFDYDANGQFDQISRYASTGTSNLVVTTDYQYDSSNRLTALTHAQGATMLPAYTWTFDAANRLVGQTSPDGAVSYSYDNRGQLTGADYDYQDDESYVYDENGNRITATNESTGTDAYATGDHNKLTFDGTYTYTYDSEGNRTARFIDADASGSLSVGDTDVTEYTWDVAKRLTRIVERDVADGPATSAVDYLYDLYGRRIEKRLDTDGDGFIDRRESYVYDQTDIILDFVDADGDGPLPSTAARRYLWGAAVDQLLTQEDVLAGTGAPEDIAWPLADHLGTTRDVIDSTGAILTHFQIDAFGSILLGDVALIRYIYTTQEYDPESGLHFYDARYYDSAVAKFISDDPSGFDADDANFSRYVGNASIDHRDPLGLVKYKEPDDPVNRFFRWLGQEVRALMNAGGRPASEVVHEARLTHRGGWFPTSQEAGFEAWPGWLVEEEALAQEQITRELFESKAGREQLVVEAYRKVLREWAGNLVTAFTPIYSDFRDFYEVATGKDLATKRPLTFEERKGTAVLAMFPFFSGAQVRRGEEALEEFREFRRAGVHDVAQATDSYYAGVQLGRAHAETKMGLKDTGWVNPFGAHPTAPGFDDVMEDAAGDLWIVEYKGGPHSHLAEGQMEPRWVTENIEKLRKRDPSWRDKLDKARREGRLHGVALKSTEGPFGTTIELQRWNY